MITRVLEPGRPRTPQLLPLLFVPPPTPHRPPSPPPTRTPQWQNGRTSGKTPPISGMAPEPNAVEQAVARALRDNLERIQRTSDELQQSINDIVAACSSSKPTNALPPMLRAQTAAASLSAALEVLARFTAMALQSGPRSPLEDKITEAIGRVAPEPPPPPARPAPSHPEPKAAAPAHAPRSQPVPERHVETELHVTEVGPVSDAEFDINQLTPEEQELHRRANRV